MIEVLPWTLPQVEATLENLGHKIFRGEGRRGFKPYDLNIWGIRNSDDPDSNNFNDFLLAAWRGRDGDWECIVSRATTDPGLKPRLDPGHKDGVAMLLPGQYRGCWAGGKHRGKYEALRQVGPMRFRRDYDKDGKLDPKGPVIEDIIGCAMHRSSATGESTLVDGWSEACQVHSDVIFFNAFMGIYRRAKASWGDRVSYTLVESKDIVVI